MYYESKGMTIECLTGEPIVISTLLEEFNFGSDIAEGNKPSFELLDSLEHPVIWIMDMSRAKLNVERLLSINLVTRGERPLWHHPMLRQIVVVSNTRLAQLAAKGLNSEVFGNLSIRVFGTLDEALDFARDL
ncbi:MAG: hypothetical protein JXB30_02590 [Anaerolineae bacterium]|nr:hypothetical protein [Anaerolineae bacterium]